MFVLNNLLIMLLLFWTTDPGSIEENKNDPAAGKLLLKISVQKLCTDG